MFGYVKAYKPELKMREYDAYKSVYCSVCHELGREFGPFARLTLSYDFTFFALLLLSIEPKCPAYKKKRCAANPLKGCMVCTKDDGAVRISAAAAMIMLYYKQRDDLQDKRGFRRMAVALTYPLFAAAHKKAAVRYPQIEEILKAAIHAQNQVESEPGAGLDRAAAPTAEALSRLFSLTADTDARRRVLKRLGYCVGKWVYLTDALADFKDDLRRGQYNPVICLLENEEKALTAQAAAQKLLPILNICISEATAAFELLDPLRYRSILANVLYLGLPDVQEQIIKKGTACS